MLGSAPVGALPLGAIPVAALGTLPATGDPLRDAFRAELAVIRSDLGLTWSIRDTLNTGDNPDAADGYIEIEFPGGSEVQYTFGSPGNNLHLEHGQVTVRLVAPRGRNRNLAELYASAIRKAFRMRRFACQDRFIRIDTTSPLGDGYNDAGMWAESIALGYRIYNVG